MPKRMIARAKEERRDCRREDERMSMMRRAMEKRRSRASDKMVRARSGTPRTLFIVKQGRERKRRKTGQVEVRKAFIINHLSHLSHLFIDFTLFSLISLSFLSFH